MAASDVLLVLPKEFGAKTAVTLSNKYQGQLKKVFAVPKIQKQPPQVFWTTTASKAVFLGILQNF